jgi:hypothetical protein
MAFDLFDPFLRAAPRNAGAHELVALAGGTAVLRTGGEDLMEASTLAALLLAPLAYLGALPGVWKRRGAAPPLASTDLDRRRPVWRVLSELYLDTWLDDGDHERIASVLVESRYSTAQLEEIRATDARNESSSLSKARNLSSRGLSI